MVRSTVPLRKYVMLARIICINISHIRRKIMFVNRFFFQLFDTFRQGSCKALPFSTRQLHSGGATQAFSSQVPTSGCNSLNLLQIVNSRFSYTSTMPLSQLAGRNILQWSCPVLRQPVTHQLCRSEISNQLQGNSAWGYTCVRTKVRCYFPRPSEVKRIKKHGLRARLSTAAGRRIIMSRLLKGRHVLSH